jgi:exopolysaccharide biosynthesis polyprenyl glycosylphosphotransferase
VDLSGAFLTWTCVLLAGGHGSWLARIADAAPLAGGVALLVVVLNGAQRLYLARVCAIRSVEVGHLARTCIASAVGAIWFGDVLGHRPSSAEVSVAALSALLVITGFRGVYAGWLRSCRAQGRFARQVCVLGSNDEAFALVELLETQPELGYRVVAVIGDVPDCSSGRLGVPAVGPGPDLVASVLAAGASGVVVAVSAFSGPQLDQVVRDLVAAGIHVQISTGLPRVGRQRLRFAPMSYQLMLYVEPHHLQRWQAFVKRTMDVILGSVGMLFALPFIVAAAIAIKLEDGGPVIYRQERVGRDGRVFELLKLRTMVPDASKQLDHLAGLNERHGPLFKLSSDPRVTRVGRLLRATSLDELPQLLNVVRGDMSLVGPRPALPAEVEQFDDELLERASVPPGLTGLWQIEARDNPSFHAYRRLDLFYVDNWSLTMDLAILAGTVWVVITRAVRAVRGGAELSHIAPRQPVAATLPVMDRSSTASRSFPA